MTALRANDRGFTLIEALVALAISGFVLTALGMRGDEGPSDSSHSPTVV